MAVRAVEGGGGSGGGGEERDAHVALVTPVCLSFYGGGGGGHYCEVGFCRIFWFVYLAEREKCFGSLYFWFGALAGPTKQP